MLYVQKTDSYSVGVVTFEKYNHTTYYILLFIYVILNHYNCILLNIKHNCNNMTYYIDIHNISTQRNYIVFVHAHVSHLSVYRCKLVFVEITWLIAEYIESLLVGTEARKSHTHIYIVIVCERVSLQPLNACFLLK